MKVEKVTLKPHHHLKVLVKSFPYAHAILYKEYDKEYVYCFDYNVETGSWGHGVYTNSFEDAWKELVKRM